MESHTVHEGHIILVIFQNILPHAIYSAFSETMARLVQTKPLQDHKRFAFENRHRLSVSIHKTVIDKNRTVSGHSSRGAGGWQRRADSRAGAMTTRSAGSLVRGEPKENRVNSIHTHQRRSNVPRGLPKPSTKSVEDKWKWLEGRTDKNIIFFIWEVWRFSTQKSKGYTLRIQSQTYT